MSLKVVTFNANGIRSASSKGFLEWLSHENPDIVCIQETKAHHKILDQQIFCPQQYFCQYVDAEKKGYSGVAIFAKHKPKNVVSDLDLDLIKSEGRYLQFDYPKFSIASVYFPSGTSGEERQKLKFKFLDQFKVHMDQIIKNDKPFLLCGDINIAHQNIDLKNWRSNQKNSGFLPEERAWLDKIFKDNNWIDAFRVINKEPEQYTWWSHRGRARANNVGWRIDYQLATHHWLTHIKCVNITPVPLFSDHAPLTIEYSGDWFG
jgi:exodeoxyribonuclease-3